MPMPAGKPGPVQPRLQAWLMRHWWRARPTLLAQSLRPLSWLYAALARLARARAGGGLPAPVPLIVVGNLVAGGAGKTPVVIALVQALAAAGHHPGVISRGHGRRERALRTVTAAAAADEVGDEPLLIHRRTGAPVVVARARLTAARALCAAHPEVDVIVSDDGLQHHALAHDAALVVFDERGVGNGLLLPAGPLREPLPARVPAHWQVVYTGSRPSTALPGAIASRRLGAALPLARWRSGRSDGGGAVALDALRGQRLLALAGIGAPEQFFAALEAAGLEIERAPMTDHARYDAPPWPPGTPAVITTEKDAVKLGPEIVGATGAAAPQVWVVPLDCELPRELVRALLARLPGAASHRTP